MLRAAVISSLALGAGSAAQAGGSCFSRNWAEVEHSHRDLGHGRVAWTWSWNAEGVADDIIVMDCASGEGLRARARSERMQAPLPYDRREKALGRLESAVGAPHFFRFDRLAASWRSVKVPSETVAAAEEPCACAAFYPGRFDTQQTGGVLDR